MRKRLTKSHTNRMLTGTIAGIAEYFEIDPTIARVIFVFLNFILAGTPILLYILLVLIIPKANNGESAYRENYERPRRTKAQRRRADIEEEENWSDF
ncbi:PspC domain-containing protein [Enterococcus hulanensis]|uniref:PspC domain-containing protein n=1 Tax=Enterococcus hulanensis TaxID=2559929 RepID=A0ABU3EUG2_9ENTE|nr:MULTISPECIES: PspC domain-containing protein [Enterococcus]MBX8935547.1 PspC domain-containing protein [Enterococcus gilvus]MDT2598511.1 PspC domain-containing protein [Enterococcus hulanensis]MDT2607984.1 PspC domain-containing protein [Enterococcus hulanensis]MDT2615279.1 PspC domain-containing protein [Enterococcus hulanensis]MDT2626750.1 PspC domain-containing protein [Enterococcus hulanensis]